MLDVLIATEYFCFLALPVDRTRNAQICIFTHTHTFKYTRLPFKRDFLWGLARESWDSNLRGREERFVPAYSGQNCFVLSYSMNRKGEVLVVQSQFSRLVVSDSLQPHGLQHARPHSLLPTPGVHPNSCPLSRWCHLTISSSVVPFSSCPQSSPASGSFARSQFFTSGGQIIRVSASASVLPMEYSGLISFRIDWLDLLAVQGTLKSLLQHHSSKASILWHSAFFYSPTLTSIHDHWKNHSLD